MGSTEDLLISLLLLCCFRVVVILHESVFSPIFEKSLELDDDDGGLRLTDLCFKSAGLILVE